MEASYLSGYKKIINSQFGEDGVIEKIFEIIKTGDKWCVEFGAGDGKTFSNTWNLIVNKDWSDIKIEGNKKLYKKLILAYRANAKVICINKMIHFQGPQTLDNLLSKTPIPRDFDFVCIDVDGNDYHIWDSTQIYAPKVVMIEFNPTIPADVEFIQPRDIKINQGSSLLSLAKLGQAKGYELVAALDLNAFFVKKEYYPLFKIEGNAPHLIRKINKYETRLFQLYDGTLVLAGNKTLLWRGGEINQDKIQLFPKFLRKYSARINFFKKVINYFARKKKTCLR